MEFNKEYLGFSYSRRKQELYIYDRAKDKQIFSCHLNDDLDYSRCKDIVDKIESDQSEDVIKDLIIKEFSEELSNLIQSTEYYNKIINPQDLDFADKIFKISLNNYNNAFYYIISDCEQDALDALVDYLESKRETGYLAQMSELINFYTEEEIENSFITAGNHCFLINSEHLCIKEM